MSLQSLPLRLKALRLPTILARYEDIAKIARKNAWDYPEYLVELVDQEMAGRQKRRIERHLKEANLPLAKTVETIDHKRFDPKLRQALNQLQKGHFVANAHNVLLFGKPGTGKTHLAAALGYCLVQQGHRVAFFAAYALVQRLLAAKASLQLDRHLEKLDKYDAIIVDDLGYIKQDRDEMDVLFTFFSQRYERKSLIITSNLVFSQWDQIFKDPMTTAAAVDRLVHHATIVEMPGESFRQQAAKQRKRNHDSKNG